MDWLRWTCTPNHQACMQTFMPLFDSVHRPSAACTVLFGIRHRQTNVAAAAHMLTCCPPALCSPPSPNHASSLHLISKCVCDSFTHSKAWQAEPSRKHMKGAGTVVASLLLACSKGTNTRGRSQTTQDTSQPRSQSLHACNKDAIRTKSAHSTSTTCEGTVHLAAIGAQVCLGNR